MNNEIISESFDLTDAIRTHIEDTIAELESISHGDHSFHVFMSKEAKGVFAARIRTHQLGKDFFAESKDEDIYSAINNSGSQLKRQLVEDFKKRKKLQRS